MKEQEVLSGKRIRTTYRGANLYVLPMFDKDGFLASFDFSQTGRDEYDQHKTIAGMELISGLMNELLQINGGQEKVMEVCHRTSFGDSDLPGIIYKVVKEHTQSRKGAHAMKAYAGIDPGINGAVSFLDKKGRLIAVFDIPTVKYKSGKRKKRKVDIPGLKLILSSYKIKRAFLEMVSARPGQGVASMFNFGVTYGAIQGLLTGLNIEFEVIVPQAWKRHFNLIQADKDDARLTTINMFPKQADYFKYKKNVDRADATLICKYGIEYLTNRRK